MKKPESKADLRASLEQAMRRYLHEGGEIESVPPGVSGRDGDGPLRPPRDLFIEPRAERTQITEVIAALDARRRKKQEPRRKARRKPRRKTIYDDFGEPLRRVWVDD
jgi:hypothetical protein